MICYKKNFCWIKAFNCNLRKKFSAKRILDCSYKCFVVEHIILHFSGGLSARKLCCVPLDIAHTLKVLRDNVSIEPYASRALRNSRRLLILYLAGQVIGKF